MPKVKKEVQQKNTTGQIMRGRVVSAKTAKTAVVLVEGTKRHPMYHKSSKTSKRYLVHDETGVKEGDLVELIKIRPMSASKHWMIYKVVGRDMEAIITEELKEEAAEAIAQVMPVEVEEVVAEAVTEEPAVVEEKVAKKAVKPKKVKKA